MLHTKLPLDVRTRPPVNACAPQGTRTCCILCYTPPSAHAHIQLPVRAPPTGLLSTSPGRLRPLKTGAARLSIDTGVPILPLGIRGTAEALDFSSYSLFSPATWNQTVTVVVGEPLYPPPRFRSEELGPESVRGYTDMVFRALTDAISVPAS